MDPEEKMFGKGPRELTGAVDLLSHFKLQQHYDFFCKSSLPLSVSDSRYLQHVAGDTEIRKGEGMQLTQLMQDTSQSTDTNVRIQTFDLDAHGDAFQFKEGGSIELPQSEKGDPTIHSKSKGESKDKEKKHKKHKKHKERDSGKDREHKKHKHRHKDRSKDRDKDKKDRSGHHDSGIDPSKKHEKKRKHVGDENVNNMHRHKKSKHKNSKLDNVGAIKVAG